MRRVQHGARPQQLPRHPHSAGSPVLYPMPVPVPGVASKPNGAISNLSLFLGRGPVYSWHHIIYYTVVPSFLDEAKSHFLNYILE